LGAKPGDVQLFNYAVIAQASGAGEASWPALDALEATMRRKMRLGAADVEEYALDDSLPPKCQLLGRPDLGFGTNPRILKTPAAARQALKELWSAEIPGVAGGWAAVITPGETKVVLLQVADGSRAADVLAAIRKAAPVAKHLSLRDRGQIVAVVRSDRSDDAEFIAVDAVVRAKLRSK